MTSDPVPNLAPLLMTTDETRPRKYRRRGDALMTRPGFNLRLSDDLRRRLDARADRLGVSKSQIIEEALTRALAKEVPA